MDTGINMATEKDMDMVMDMEKNRKKKENN